MLRVAIGVGALIAILAGTALPVAGAAGGRRQNAGSTAGLGRAAAEAEAARRMAATVMREWPAGMVSTIKTPGQWGYEEGTLLDGMVAEWHVSGDGAEFAYVKAAVDKYVVEDGAGGTPIRGYKAEGHTLDDIEMGRAVMVAYRATHEEKYARAARFLHEQLALQPRTVNGGYWHKQIYPHQMWLDGAYMAEPFRAMYAATFGVTEDWDDIAKQLLLMSRHMQDPGTGLMRHGWDDAGPGETRMPWADPATGLSPEAWARAMGWYAMALADVLEVFPKDHPQRKALEVAFTLTMAPVADVQDSTTGLWWQVLGEGNARITQMGHGGIDVRLQKPRDGNFPEASASCMFVYALAKGVRLGLLPKYDREKARRGWEGIQRRFVTQGPDGGLVLHGTVKVGGLGGTPYRSGTFEYYTHEGVGDQDAKGVGAFLLAGSEMQLVGK